MLDDPSCDRREALLGQRAEPASRAERAADMIRAIDAVLAVIDEKDMAKEKADMKTIFDGFDAGQYADEARHRWGGTEAYRISAERAKTYSESDWRKIKDEQAAIMADARAVLEAGVAPDDPRAMDVAAPIVDPALVLSVQRADALRSRGSLGSRSPLRGEHRPARCRSHRVPRRRRAREREPRETLTATAAGSAAGQVAGGSRAD